MTAQPAEIRFLTYEEYEVLEETSGIKHEYYRGEVFPLGDFRTDDPQNTGCAGWNHVLLVANLTAVLHNALRERGCFVLPADMRVHIEAFDLDTYPDVSVVCGAPAFLSEKRTVLLNPLLIVEVLSPSTESYDRGQKFAFYRSIPSLREYVLVSQDRRNVEAFRKNEAGHWVLYEPDPKRSSMELASVDCTLHLDDLYAGVAFGATGERAHPGEGASPA